MNRVVEKIQTITSRGQITLPIAWRRRVNAGQIVLRVKDDMVEIIPVRLQKQESSDYTVFDALRDNKGKGIKAKSLIRLIEKIDSRA
jgi:bifunctional DNA-binding transcriptional regulator/antitoxin component of YhaV-PrlF toxin-antitoxin module